MRTEKKLEALKAESARLNQKIEDDERKISQFKADIERAKTEAREMEQKQDKECGSKLSVGIRSEIRFNIRENPL